MSEPASNSKASSSAGGEKQLLTVSSPCLLLNHIAQRYTRTSRIIMEYVDNSLDDCEALFDEDTNAYSRAIQIDVRINRTKVGDGMAPDSDGGPDAPAPPAAKPEAGTDEKQSEPGKKAKKGKKKAAPAEQWFTEVSVSDNCRGMSKATLNRLVANVGESSKRGSKFTNGHFGFGVHAFRACAKKISFHTKQEGGRVLFLEMDRKSEYFMKPKWQDEGIDTAAGTEVRVTNFDNTWSEQLDPREIIKEIQHHFSGLLERGNLQVLVHDVAKAKSTVCRPFSFNMMSLRKSINKDFDFGEETCRVRLYVSNKAQNGKNCMFVAKGRRVNEVSDVKSFMKMSRCRWAVWGHPNLVGFIDVSNILEPVITRDEFRLNKARKDVFRKIIEEVEPILYKALHEVNENRRIMALARLEDVVAKCVNVAVKKDVRRQSEGLTYLQQIMMAKKPVRSRKIDEDFDVETNVAEKPSRKRKRLTDEVGPNAGDAAGAAADGKDGRPKKKKRTGLGFNIAFVKDLTKEGTQEPCRARLVGEDVQINMKHPDFLTRIKVSKTESQPVVTERLCGYLANVIAAAYKSHALLRGGGLEKYKEDHSSLLDEILDVTLSLENQLRSKLKLMQKEMEQGAATQQAPQQQQV